MFSRRVPTCLRYGISRRAISDQSGETSVVSPPASVSVDSFEIGIIDAVHAGLEAAHAASGMPWWADLIALTIGFRTAVAVPLSVLQHRNLAKYENMVPEIRQWQEAIRHKVTVQSRKAGLDATVADATFKRELTEKTQSLLRREGLYPLWAKSTLPLFAQIPVWVSISLALRQMTDIDQSQIESLYDFRDGGCLWFPNLLASDDWTGLPLLLGCVGLANMEFLYYARAREHIKSKGTFQQALTFTLRGVSIGMVAVASQVPAALSLYWATGACFSLVQNIAIQFPKVRRFVGIPETPTEARQPLRAIAARAAEGWTEFVEDVKNKNRVRNGESTEIAPSGDKTPSGSGNRVSTGEAEIRRNPP